VVATGHQDERLGVDFANRIPGRLDGLVAVTAKEVPAARSADLLGHPVPDRERRIEPFDRDDARTDVPGVAPGGDQLLDGPESRSERLDEVEGVVLDLGHRADRGDRVEDPLDRRRLERDHGDRGVDRTNDLVDLPVADRAHVAQLLREDEIGFKRLELLVIQRVERRAAVHRGGHQRVDFATRQLAEVVRVARHDRLADHLGRPVALVGHADELVAEPEGTDDLGGGGEQGNDSNVSAFYGERRGCVQTRGARRAEATLR
jgi:hypothetical protein